MIESQRQSYHLVDPSGLFIKLVNGVYGIFILYIQGYNLIMGILLAINWGIPHELVIGWEGVSLTPILVTTKAQPNSIFYLPLLLLLYNAIIWHFSISHWWRDLRKKNHLPQISYVSTILIERGLGALIRYMWGHLFLFCIVITNNWGLAPMAFVLGTIDVRILPIFG